MSATSGRISPTASSTRSGIPVRGTSGRFDWGRYDGIKTLRASRFNLLSRHNDDRSGANAVSTRHVALGLESYGAFKVPGLRNVALTAPYMHNGSLASLRDVVNHYSEIDDVKLQLAVPHPHAEPGEPVPPPASASVLQPLHLSAAQIADMVAFLETLTEKNPLSRPPAPKAAVCTLRVRVAASRVRTVFRVRRKSARRASAVRRLPSRAA